MPTKPGRIADQAFCYATMVHHFLYPRMHSDEKIRTSWLNSSLHWYLCQRFGVSTSFNFYSVDVNTLSFNTVRVAVINDGQRRNRSSRGHTIDHSEFTKQSWDPPLVNHRRRANKETKSVVSVRRQRAEGSVVERVPSPHCHRQQEDDLLRTRPWPYTH